MISPLWFPVVIGALWYPVTPADLSRPAVYQFSNAPMGSIQPKYQQERTPDKCNIRDGHMITFSSACAFKP
jgi:hypothetical protein